METPTVPIEALFEKVKDYTKSSAELYRLRALKIYSDVVSTVVTQLVLIIVVAMCVTALNIGIALWLGNIIGQAYYGFFIVAAFYLLLGIVIYAFRKQWIKTPLRNAIITKMQK